MKAGETDAARREFVENRSLDGGVAVGAEIVVAEIVGHDENDVGRACFG
jgi:hypothetical protein